MARRGMSAHIGHKKIICRPALAFEREAGAAFTELAQKFGIGRGRAAIEVRAMGMSVRHYNSRACRTVIDTNGLDLAELAAAYESGETTVTLAARYGCDQRTIAKYLKAAGAKMRPRGVRPRARDPLSPDEWGAIPLDEDALCRARAQNGKTLQELADEFRCSLDTVRRRLRAHGLT